MKTLLTAVSALALAAPAFAQDWALDREASSVEFDVTVFGNTSTGAFEAFSADITLDPEDLENARIDATVATGSAELSNADYRSALNGADGLNPDEHPEARFESDQIVETEDGYEARGTLTIRGQAREAVLPFTLEIEGDRAVADGELEIVWEDYGLGGSGWGDVGDTVTVRVHVEADARP